MNDLHYCLFLLFLIGAFALSTPLSIASEEYLPDTLSQERNEPLAIHLDRSSFTCFGYKDAGEIAAIAPGHFPRQTTLYAQPFYLVSPGASGRELLVLYRGRPYNNPITGAADLSAFAPEEIESLDLSSGNYGSTYLSSSSVLRLNVPRYYPTKPRTQLVYRQGFYGLGHVDWRIAQSVSPQFRYHIGINIGEYRGARLNSKANISLVRLGGEQNYGRYGCLGLYWMQTRLDYGEPLGVKSNSIHRNDLDLIWRSGVETDTLYAEVGGWYTRNKQGYGYNDEDGYRLGLRASLTRKYNSQESTWFSSAERVAARFARTPGKEAPKGLCDISALGLEERYRKDKLSIRLGLRMELFSSSEIPAEGDRDIHFRAGGSLDFDFGDSLGLGILETTSLGWRPPGLDETYGFWTIHSPQTSMDLNPVPDSSLKYEGNKELTDPVGGFFSGVGGRWNFPNQRYFRIIAGYRSIINPLHPVEIVSPAGGDAYATTIWTTQKLGEQEGYELTSIGWIDLYGPFSLAGSYTWSNVGDEEEPVPDSWGWASLRFLNHYYQGQLRLRITLTARYWGTYKYQDSVQPAEWFWDGLIHARIFNFEVYWGTNNITSRRYEFLPSYPAMHRDEIWGVRWILFD